ncbi:hypothetical protein L211DRAFT_850753 [Terfezia boudieri ATCC MYA-4762]|uniref:Uncharacterized protein n=1 Tax=Terfezia boudieri ATCC MYA-4762 TaxID=1051890 RepID=A0A3N4LH48_9PEZI|nr:hypothetical protein L211DRAFT_850753 [Terfezia boudieri ATCC MYA-4762]
MQKLEQVNPNAIQYLRAIDSKLWVTAFYEGPYYGHKTSNIVESTNNVFRNDHIDAPIQQQNNRGRPKVKRFLPGSARKHAHNAILVALQEQGEGSQACRKCRKYGHNRRTYDALDQLQLFEPGYGGNEENIDMEGMGNEEEELDVEGINDEEELEEEELEGDM